MANTVNAGLPLLATDQAQKHVTVNTAMQLIDALLQTAVIDRDLTAPPASPVEGDRYIVAAGATDDWAGEDGRVAVYLNAGWTFLVPAEGWMAHVRDEGVLVWYTGSAWAVFAPAQLGVNTAPDSNNRLAVRAENALFTNEGGNARITINKAAAGDTASVVFQNGFTGYAEFGLAGSDAFALKVSDGVSFVDAISFSYDGTDTFVTLAANRLDVSNLPTSAAGLAAGQVYVDVDTLKVA